MHGVDIGRGFGERAVGRAGDARRRSAIMTLTIVATHLLFVLALFALAAAATWAMVRVAILDIPNHRSSHGRPLPNGGGVAIVLTVLVGFAVVYGLSDTRIAARHMIGLGAAALAVVAVGLLDDLGRIRTFRLKLTAQILAAAVLLAFGIVIRRLTLPYIGTVELGWWGYPVTLVWLIAFTNIFNFMDGLNGLAGGTAAIVAAFFGLLTFLTGALFVHILCYIVLAASLGFLVFNFPRPRIFMGDVGSQFLGFLFAAMAVIAAGYDGPRTSLLFMPLLFFNFIFDTGFTLVRRFLAGEDVTQAHRAHLYQLLNRLGWSHVRVTLFHFALTVAQGLAALWLLRVRSDLHLLAILPFLAFDLAYMAVVMQAARRRGLV